jgi:phage tail sheath protein FI
MNLLEEQDAALLQMTATIADHRGANQPRNAQLPVGTELGVRSRVLLDPDEKSGNSES